MRNELLDKQFQNAALTVKESNYGNENGKSAKNSSNHNNLWLESVEFCVAQTVVIGWIECFILICVPGYNFNEIGHKRRY